MTGTAAESLLWASFRYSCDYLRTIKLERLGGSVEKVLAMLSQKQTFENETSAPLEVMVEPAPDRYVLQPHDKMVVEAEFENGQEPFTVLVYDGGLTIYPAIWPLSVWINGQLATPDWATPGPNATKSSPKD